MGGVDLPPDTECHAVGGVDLPPDVECQAIGGVDLPPFDIQHLDTDHSALGGIDEYPKFTQKVG